MAVNKVFYRSPHNYDVVAASNEAALADPGVSLTVQSAAEDCDLNVIMKRFGIGAALPVNPRPPMYGDFTEIGDYRSALNAVRNAEMAFMEFPAELRARFANNPQMMLEFVENPANYDEAVKLGICKARAPVNPPTPVVPPVAAAHSST